MMTQFKDFRIQSISRCILIVNIIMMVETGPKQIVNMIWSISNFIDNRTKEHWLCASKETSNINDIRLHN